MQKLKFVKNCSNWLECENIFTYNIHLKVLNLLCRSWIRQVWVKAEMCVRYSRQSLDDAVTLLWIHCSISRNWAIGSDFSLYWKQTSHCREFPRGLIQTKSICSASVFLFIVSRPRAFYFPFHLHYTARRFIWDPLIQNIISYRAV